MAFGSLVVLFALATVAVANPVTDIHVLPGFENFKPCNSVDCWHEAKEALRTLLRTGYEPLGIHKVEPLFVKHLQAKEDIFSVNDDNAHIKITGLDSFDDAKYIVDKDNKVIEHEISVSLKVKGAFEAVFKLEHDHKFDLQFESEIPKVLLIIKRHYTKEVRPYNGKDAEFLVPKEHEFSFKLLEKPTHKPSAEYVEAVKKDAEVTAWFEKHDADHEKVRASTMGPILQKVADAFLHVFEVIDNTFPAEQFVADFDTKY